MLRYLAILSVCFLFTSCFDYVEEESLVSYGDRADYRLSDVLQEDWGAHSGEHYNMDFTFIGENVVFDENRNQQGQTYYTFNSTPDCYIFVELFSTGQEQFSQGKFTAVGSKKLNEVIDQNVFRRFFFGRDLNEIIEASQGTITLSITSSGTYRFYFDVKLENGRPLKGFFIGNPHYFNRFE